MIGLLVLAALVVWFFAARGIARWLVGAMPVKANVRPWASGGVFALVFVLPVADELAMWPWFVVHCREAASMNIDTQKIRGRSVLVTVEPEDGRLHGLLLPVYYSHFQYRDAVSGDLLADYKTYSADGGLLSRSIGWTRPLTGGFHCAPEERQTAQKVYQFKFVN